MTINTTSSKITYQADGSTTQWSFPFPGVSSSDIRVFVSDSSGNTVQLPPSAFSVVLNPPIDPNPTSIGGIVNYPLVGPPLAIGNQLDIERVLPAVQDVSLTNQSVIYPPVIEQALDYLTMLDQQGVAETGRAFTASPVDPTPLPTVPVAQRANQWAFFDANGNLTPAQAPGGAVAISAVMQPVVGAATLQLARQLMGVSQPALVVTTTFVVTGANERQVLALKGNAFYSVTLAGASGFSSTFWVLLFNEDTRGKQINISGSPIFILWPTQHVWVFNDGAGNWMVSNPSRWHSDTNQNFYVNPTLGLDTNDGLATGNQAFQTIQNAVNIVQSSCDGNFTINLANGTYPVGAGVVCSLPVSGADGYNIIGNAASPSSVIIQGSGGAGAIGSGTFVARDNAVVSISGVTITAVFTSGFGSGFRCKSGAVMNLSNIVLGNMGANGTGIFCDTNATITITNNLYIASGATFAWVVGVSTAGFILYNPGTTTILGSISCQVFIECQFCANLHSNDVAQAFSNPGFVTGTQYGVRYNGVATIGGPVPPGTVGGTFASGGIWV